MPRFVRRSTVWAVAAAGLGLVYAWSRWQPEPEQEPPPAPPIQPENRDKVKVGKLLAGALVLAALAGAWFGYQGWALRRENEAVAKAITGGNPANADALFTRYGCGGCHTIPGATGADGEVAPPLGGLRKRVYVGGVLRNTPENLIAWIVEPQLFSPNSAMPTTGISTSEARDVAAYLYAN